MARSRPSRPASSRIGTRAPLPTRQAMLPPLRSLSGRAVADATDPMIHRVAVVNLRDVNSREGAGRCRQTRDPNQRVGLTHIGDEAEIPLRPVEPHPRLNLRTD